MFLILVCFYLDLDYKTCFSRVKSNRISLSLLGKNAASNLKLRLAISRQRIFPKLSVSMALNWNFYITRLFCMKPCYCLYFSFFYFTRRNTFKKRKLKVTMMKKKIRDFRVFNFALNPRWKTWKSKKVFLNFWSLF